MKEKTLSPHTNREQEQLRLSALTCGSVSEHAIDKRCPAKRPRYAHLHLALIPG
jgi:hypothetical protein